MNEFQGQNVAHFCDSGLKLDVTPTISPKNKINVSKLAIIFFHFAATWVSKLFNSLFRELDILKNVL